MSSEISSQIIEKIITYEVEEHLKTSKLLYDLIPDIICFSKIIINALNKNKKLLICGNGGSAADSQHFSSELIGRFEKDRNPIGAISLSTDNSAITSISNDQSFDYIFSRQIDGIGYEGDVLIIISTSGNSRNILKAIESAKNKNIQSLGLLGNSGGEAIKNLDNSILIKSNRTCRIQEMHGLIIHIICGLIEKFKTAL